MRLKLTHKETNGKDYAEEDRSYGSRPAESGHEEGEDSNQGDGARHGGKKLLHVVLDIIEISNEHTNNASHLLGFQGIGRETGKFFVHEIDELTSEPIEKQASLKDHVLSCKLPNK